MQDGRAQERAAPADLVAIGMDPGFSFCWIPVLSAPGASDNSSGAILTAECPVVAYRQGAADLCAAYGLASAMHHYGDASGGTAIAACATLASASARLAAVAARGTACNVTTAATTRTTK